MKHIRIRDFWNCLCETDYVHRRYESFCNRCCTTEENQPDSDGNEVKEYLNAEYDAMIYQVDVADCYGRYEIGVLLRNAEDMEKINGLLGIKPNTAHIIKQANFIEVAERIILLAERNQN